MACRGTFHDSYQSHHLDNSIQALPRWEIDSSLRAEPPWELRPCSDIILPCRDIADRNYLGRNRHNDTEVKNYGE